jgi:hypothetical protein
MGDPLVRPTAVARISDLLSNICHLNVPVEAEAEATQKPVAHVLKLKASKAPQRLVFRLPSRIVMANCLKRPWLKL